MESVSNDPLTPDPPRVGGPAAERLLRELKDRHPVRNGLVGESPELEHLFERLLRLARSDVPVLIVGEVGAGKETVARAIHLNSDRSGGPFVAESCAALREPLLLSRLFGHSRGAFTGAASSVSGLFEEADRGTLCLDEVGDLSLPAQACLARAIESGEYRPLGSSHLKRSDFRLIVTTSSDLRSLMYSGLFRRDLYFRIRGAVLKVPPLRDRRSDILPLAEQILRDAAMRGRRAPNMLDACAREALVEYLWPGNIRELRQELTQAMALAGADPLTASHFQFLREPPPSASDLEPRRHPLRQHLGRVESEAIQDALRLTGGNKAEAARRLGITRRTLYRRIELLAQASRPGAGAGGGPGERSDDEAESGVASNPA